MAGALIYRMILLLRQRQASDRGAPHPSWIRITTALRVASGCAQEGERGIRRRADVVGCGRAAAAQVERRLGIAARLAACVPDDRRDPERISHGLEEMLRLRMFAIAAGYEDADDCDELRHDPVFKMAVGRRRRAASRCARSRRCRGWRTRRARSRSRG